MSPDQINIVKKTWRKLSVIDPELIGDLFYSKLFYDHPELRSLFPKDMKEQYIKLTDMLTSIITGLNNLEKNKDKIIEMGQRHIDYGVKTSHYSMVGNALLWTVEKGLGTDWNSGVKEAYIACYDTMVNLMLSSKK